MLRSLWIVQHSSSLLGPIFQHLQGAPYLHSLLQAALCTPCKGVVHLSSSFNIVRL